MEEYKREGIHFILSDIKNPELKKRLSNIKFDIIIDDGDHHLPSVLNVVDNYLSSLKVEGVLIIEDCQQPRIWVEQIARRLLNYGKKYILSIKDLRDSTNRPWGYDDFLIIVKREK